MAVAFLLLAVAVYHGSVDAPLLGDARLLTIENRLTRAPDGLAHVWTTDFFAGAALQNGTYRTGYYRPVTRILYWLEYRIAGARGRSYNLIQMLLHGLNAFLVFALCAQVRRGRLAAAIAGLFFVLHPVHAFAATEPAALGDLAAASFFVLALLAFDSALLDDRRLVALWKVGLASFLYVLALLSKEMAITLPAVLVLLVLYRHFRSDARPPIRRLAWTLPAWSLLLVYLVWRYAILDLPDPSAGYTEIYSPFTLALNGTKSAVVYISRIVLPLGAEYPQLNPWLANFIGDLWTDPLFYLALAVLAALALLASLPHRVPFLAFWSGFFLVTFAPLLAVDKTAASLGLNMILTDERWIYLPSIAVFAVIGHALARLGAALPHRAGRGALALAVVLAALTLGRSAAAHAGRTEDPYARLRALYALPEDRLARLQKADKLILYARWVAMPSGDLQEAEARTAEAVRLAPDSPIPVLAHAEVLAHTGRWERAVRVLSPWLAPPAAQLRKWEETNPGLRFELVRTGTAIAHLLARAHTELGDGERAMRLLCESVRRWKGAETRVKADALAQTLWRNYALNGPPSCAVAPDPERCVADVNLPEGEAWRPPFDGTRCPSWVEPLQDE